MAADYTKAPAGAPDSPDDRLRPTDERPARSSAYVNHAQTSGLPLASRVSTRGRPV
jgi:hypothetical protein